MKTQTIDHLGLLLEFIESREIKTNFPMELISISCFTVICQLVVKNKYYYVLKSNKRLSIVNGATIEVRYHIKLNNREIYKNMLTSDLEYLKKVFAYI